MLIEINSNLNNSLTHNPLYDDPTLKNYIALYYCIVGVEDKYGKRHFVEPGKALGALELGERRERPYKKRTKPKKGIYTEKEILVTNIKTGECKKYNGSREIAKDFEINMTSIGNYIRRQYIFKKTYKFNTVEN